MMLELYNNSGKFVSELNSNEKTLQELNVADNYSIHVTDITGSSAIFDTNSEFSERYVMDNAKYDSLKGIHLFLKNFCKCIKNIT